MYIEDLIIPAFASSRAEIRAIVRRKTVILCEGASVHIRRMVIEFESEDFATAFEKDLITGSARIIIEDDVSLNTMAKGVLEKLFVCLKTGNKEELKNVLDELRSFSGENLAAYKRRRASGVKRIAVMHDHGVAAYGFQGMKRPLRKWMTAHGFPAQIWNLDVM